jgi:hypothetical protein
VPPVGGAPSSRHTGTGGAADGVHDQHLRDSGLRCWAGDRSRVVPRSKQLGGVEWYPEQQLCKQPDEAMSSKQLDEAMSSSRGDARAAKRVRTGGAKIAL